MNKVLLVITDGVGHRSEIKGNAVKLAKMQSFNKLLDVCPNCLLNASGNAVGLPENQMGNSEVGHLAIGSGRIINQDLVRISNSIKNKSFFSNKVILDALEYALNHDSAFHILGLLSDGGIHSHKDHLYAVMKLAKEKGIKKLFIHPFLDGRDTDPHSGISFLRELKDKIEEIGIGKIADISGRYYSMDRDKRWERTKLSYDMLTQGAAVTDVDFIHAIKESYENGITDEFVRPVSIVENGKPVGLIKNNDSIFFINFRGDRARQIVRTFVDDNLTGFIRTKRPIVYFACMAEYDSKLGLPVAFIPIDVKNCLAEVISKSGVKQLHIAETEKYAHVTFFFNGGKEESFLGEDRIIIPSPKVATYDMEPQMRASKITDKVVNAMTTGQYGFIIVNYANGDMVGHTAIMDAAIVAMNTIDESIGRLHDASLKNGFTLIITADHGNIEQEINDDGSPMTAHTVNPVYFILCNYKTNNPNLGNKDKAVFGLSSVAPTILKIMGIDKPDEMTGVPLI